MHYEHELSFGRVKIQYTLAASAWCTVLGDLCYCAKIFTVSLSIT